MTDYQFLMIFGALLILVAQGTKQHGIITKIVFGFIGCGCVLTGLILLITSRF